VKKIEAFVKTSRLDEIVNRLRLIGTTGMTVTAVHGLGAKAAPRYQLMVVVHDEDAAHVVAAIVHAGRTDSPGDGIVTVMDVDGVMRIRTNEIDAEAL
jgi:nitrogen regulatory protein PII